MSEQQQPPRFPLQPGRLKFAKPLEMHRAMRSKCASRRPVCAECGQVAPAPDKARDDWGEKYGHTKPLSPEQRAKGWKRGDPCKGNVMLPHEYAALWARQHFDKYGEIPPGYVSEQLALFPLPEGTEPAPRPRRLVRVISQHSEPRVSTVPPQLKLFEAIEEVVA